MSDIVDQLYDASVCSPAQNYCRNHLRMEAAAMEIERLREALRIFMEITSEERGWGTIKWMDNPDMYTQVAKARGVVESMEQKDG